MDSRMMSEMIKDAKEKMRKKKEAQRKERDLYLLSSNGEIISE